MPVAYLYVVGASKNPDRIECAVPWRVDDDEIFFGPCKTPLREKLRPELLGPETDRAVPDDDIYFVGFNALGVPRGRKLVVSQRDRSVRVDELGSMIVAQPALGSGEHGLRWLVEEDLADRVERSLRFVARVLGIVDDTERLTHAAVMCALLGAAHAGWKTREELQRQPNSGTIGMADDRIVAALRPPVRTREEVHHNPRSIADDLVHLLRRAHSPSRR